MLIIDRRTNDSTVVQRFLDTRVNVIPFTP